MSASFNRIDLSEKGWAEYQALRERELIVSADYYKISGKGLFVGEEVKVGQLVVEFTGERLSIKQADKLYYKKYLMILRHEAIDSINGGVARYINHSCRPNAYFRIIKLEGEEEKEVVFVYAKRDIKVGEELTVYYEWPFVAGLAFEDCNCGVHGCPKYIGL